MLARRSQTEANFAKKTKKITAKKNRKESDKDFRD